MRMLRFVVPIAAAMLAGGCASHVQRPTESAAARPTAARLSCPTTVAPIKPRAGGTRAPLGDDPTGAIACIANEPPSKRANLGPGNLLPASVAVVLARLIDAAAPADDATAKKCAPSGAVLLTRFSYRSGPVDVAVSIGCSAGHVAYVHEHGYLLAPVVANYLQGITDPSSGSLVPDVMGEPLAKAEAAAEQAGDSFAIDGEIVDQANTGTVLLQYPTLNHQVEVVAAVAQSPPCRTDQLAIQYMAGGAGMGNDFGTILVRNVSSSWCELTGAVQISGLIHGQPVTRTVTVAVAADLELSPHARPAGPDHASPLDQLAASLPLSAEYRDDGRGSLCGAHWIVPTAWRVVVGSATLTVPNARANADARPPGAGGLITCRGNFGAGELQLATT